MLYAKALGYFWMPCPKCGEMFGGHQATWTTVTVQEADGPHAYVVCPDCDTPELRAENERQRAAVIGSMLSEAMKSGDLQIVQNGIRLAPGEGLNFRIGP
jgi:phage terminase large subunit GpA-like protein